MATTQFRQHQRIPLHLCHRPRAIFPAFEFVRCYLKGPQLLPVLPHHVPESTHLAGIPNTALVAGGNFSDMNDAAKVTHMMPPAVNVLFETGHCTLSTLFHQGGDYKQ